MSSMFWRCSFAQEFLQCSEGFGHLICSCLKTYSRSEYILGANNSEITVLGRLYSYLSFLVILLAWPVLLMF